MVTIFEVDLSFLFLTITPFPAFPQGEGASTFPPRENEFQPHKRLYLIIVFNIRDS